MPRYDYLPSFYSRVFEYEGSPRKIWWQFYGDNGKHKWCLILFYTLCFVIGWCQLVPFLYFTPLSFYSTVGETVEVGNFDPKIATFWIDSGNIYNFCFRTCTGVCNSSWYANFILASLQVNWKVFSLKAEALRYFLCMFYFFSQTRNRSGSTTNEPRTCPWTEVQFSDISKDRRVMIMGDGYIN